MDSWTTEACRWYICKASHQGFTTLSKFEPQEVRIGERYPSDQDPVENNFNSSHTCSPEEFTVLSQTFYETTRGRNWLFAHILLHCTVTYTSVGRQGPTSTAKWEQHFEDLANPSRHFALELHLCWFIYVFRQPTGDWQPNQHTLLLQVLCFQARTSVAPAWRKGQLSKYDKPTSQSAPRCKDKLSWEVPWQNTSHRSPFFIDLTHC